MRDNLRLIALALAALFVLTAVPIVFMSNLGTTVTDRDAVKQAVRGEVLLDVATTAVIRGEVEELPALKNLPPLVLESTTLQESIGELIPADWATGQTDAIVDAVFNYMETGDESVLALTIQIGPLFDSLAGEPGRQMVLGLLESLPPCSLDQLPTVDLATGEIDITVCMPPLIPVDLVATQLHGLMAQVINEETATAILGDELEFDLLGRDPEVRAARINTLESMRRFYSWSQFGVWLLWLVPLACLVVILILVVRSLGGFGHWWGWPVAIAGAVTLLMATLFSSTLLNIGLDMVGQSATAAGAGLLVNRLMRVSLEALADIWLARVRLQAGLTLITGLYLIAVGFIGNWMFARLPENGSR